MLITKDDFSLLAEQALEFDRDEEPRPLHEWFFEFARNLRLLAHDTIPGLDSPQDSEIDEYDPWEDNENA